MLSERSTFLLPLSLTLLVTFFSLGTLNYTVSKTSARSEVINNALPLFRDAIYSDLSALFKEPVLISSVIANDTFIKSWAEDGEESPEQMVEYLAGIREALKLEAAFFISAQTNVYYHYTGVHRALEKNRPEDAWYFTFLESSNKIHLNVNNDDVFNDDLLLFTDIRMENQDGKLLGVTGVAVRFSHFTELLTKQQKNLAQRVYLTNDEGLIQVHTDLDQVKKRSLNDMPGHQEILQDIISGNKESRNYTVYGDRGNVLVSTLYLESIGWYLVVEQDESSFVQSANQNLKRTVFIGIFSTVIILSIGLLMVHKYQRSLAELAITDSLTGLVNRRGFLELFKKAQGRVGRNDQQYALAIIDLDYFKDINDTYGHHVGDEMLTSFARRVNKVLRSSDVLARWGGDEFLLLIEGDSQMVNAIFRRIRKSVESSPVTELEGTPLYLSMSCGISFVEKNDTIDSANKRADHALYEAKAAGRGRTHFYEIGKQG